MSYSALAPLAFLVMAAVVIAILGVLFLALMVAVGLCMMPVVIALTALGNLVRGRAALRPERTRPEAARRPGAVPHAPGHR